MTLKFMHDSTLNGTDFLFIVSVEALFLFANKCEYIAYVSDIVYFIFVKKLKYLR